MNDSSEYGIRSAVQTYSCPGWVELSIDHSMVVCRSPNGTGPELTKHRVRNVSFVRMTVAWILAALVSGCGREPSSKESNIAANASRPTPVIVEESRRADAPPESASAPVPAPTPAPAADAGDFPEWDATALQRDGMEALTHGDVDTAFDIARQAIRLAPDDPQVIFLMALTLGKRNRFPEAIAMLDQLASSAPQVRLPVLGQTAEWMVRFGQYSEAENRYRTILDEVPDVAMVHRNLAQLLLRQGRRIEAKRHLIFLCGIGDVQESELRSLLSLFHPFPNDFEVQDPIGVLGHARAEISKNDWETARNRLEESQEIGPEEMALLERVYLHASDVDTVRQSNAVQSNAVQSDPSQPSPDAWFAKGVGASNRGEHLIAVRCLAECVLRDPTDAEAYQVLSRSLNELGESGRADEALRLSEWIRQTQIIGAKFATDDEPADEDMMRLIELLEKLDRPLEMLAWRGIRLVYAGQSGDLSENDVQSGIADIVKARAEVLKQGDGQPAPSFVLCGIDVNAYPLETPPKKSESR